MVAVDIRKSYDFLQPTSLFIYHTDANRFSVILLVPRYTIHHLQMILLRFLVFLPLFSHSSKCLSSHNANHGAYSWHPYLVRTIS